MFDCLRMLATVTMRSMSIRMGMRTTTMSTTTSLPFGQTFIKCVI